MLDAGLLGVLSKGKVTSGWRDLRKMDTTFLPQLSSSRPRRQLPVVVSTCDVDLEVCWWKVMFDALDSGGDDRRGLISTEKPLRISVADRCRLM